MDRIGTDRVGAEPRVGQSPGVGQTPGLFDTEVTADEPRVGAGRASGADRALILHAIAQAGRASGSGRSGVDVQPRAAEMPADYFPGYEVLGEIHRGGQGVVYRAVQKSTKRVVALKLMHGSATAGTTGWSAGRARFEREVEVLGRLNHPGIVKVHDSGQTADGGLYYVMDLIAGEPLDAIIRRWRAEAEKIRRASSVSGSSRALSRSASRSSTALGVGVLRERLELFAKVCEGVHAAHVAGVIHRDLKPANIRLDERGEPVVVDFGLAKVTQSASPAGEMTTTGQFIGSMPWSSPEQAEGAHASVDTRSDVYSLGVILYQVVTGGRFPYPVIGTMREVMQNIVSAEPERPGLIDRGVNDEVETIVLKALAKERERRYQSAGELARDVRRYLAGEPIEAKRDSGLYVLSKAVRRHRAPVGFAAAIAVLTVGFTVALAFKYAEAEGLRREAMVRETGERNARMQAEIERGRAEENFEAVRGLARTFMFDFADEIEHLRGATAARGLVVDEAAAYLERLRTQAERDATPPTGLLLELAAAYDRLADLQAASAEANRGETDAAAASLAMAAAVRRGVLDRDPGDSGTWLELGRGMVARARVEQRLGAFEDAIATGHEALGAFDRAEGMGAASEALAEARADAFVLLSDLHLRLGQAARERAAAEARLEEAMLWLARAEALWAPRAAAGDADAAAAMADLAYSRARAMGELAEHARRAGEPGAAALALAALEQAVSASASFEALRADDPASRPALYGLITARLQEGLAWSMVAEAGGEGAEPARLASLEVYQRALDEGRALAVDEIDLEAARLVGAAMNRVGNALRDLGRLDEAAAVFDASLAQRRGIYRTDPVTRHARDLALAIGKRAEIDRYLAQRTGDPADRAALLASSAAGFGEALGVFRELAADGVPMDREIAMTQRVIGQIEALRAAGAASP